ncbi:unnamed protein product [Effrenium voratum]|nr:unnamed protein product [Effrenium voratum]
MAPRRGLQVQYHVRAGRDPKETFDAAARYAAFHGFCCIETEAQDAGPALAEARGMEGFLKEPPEIVIDGLLGEDGSARIAALDESEGALKRLDGLLGTFASGLAACDSAGEVGVRDAERSPVLLHEASMADHEYPAITEVEAEAWLPIFLRQRLMLILFLGPGRGTLELQPYDEEGCPMRVATEPGMLCAVRADLLWRRFSCAPGVHSYALSCFLLRREGAAAGDIARTPVAERLDTWLLRRIEALAEKGNDPRWQYSLDHMYHKEEQYAVRGLANKISVNWDPYYFTNALLSGSDFVTEVPHTRWDHNTYFSSEPDSWKMMKVSCYHSSFVDGMELFDARFFRIAPAEVKSMDPMQRQILEVGYAALHAAGHNTKTLLQSLTAIFVGSPTSEWTMIDTGPEESGGCAQRSAGTGVAASIMSNRFSFVFGMNGPSVTFDTDASTSLVVLDAGVVALDGRRTQATMSSCTGVVAVLTPLTWLGRIALGHLTKLGRCFTYDQCCDGWSKSEHVASCVVDMLTNTVDGLLVEDDRPYVGTVAGVAVTHMGQAATLGTPHGPAVQKAVLDACRQSGLSCTSVDAMECNGDALPLNDAVEVHSIRAALQAGIDRIPLQAATVKSGVGNGLQAAALAGLIKVLLGQRKGMMHLTQHLHQIHPLLQDAQEQNVMFASENLSFYTRSSVHGITAMGWGGTLGCVMCTGSTAEYYRPVSSRTSPLMLWLGGGGSAPTPQKAYYLVGSWNRWGEGIAMEEEAFGIYVATLEMRQSLEEFCISVDGKAVLQPDPHWTQSGSRAFYHEQPGKSGKGWSIQAEAGRSSFKCGCWSLASGRWSLGRGQKVSTQFNRAS